MSTEKVWGWFGVQLASLGFDCVVGWSILTRCCRLSLMSDHASADGVLTVSNRCWLMLDRHYHCADRSVELSCADWFNPNFELD